MLVTPLTEVTLSILGFTRYALASAPLLIKQLSFEEFRPCRFSWLCHHRSPDVTTLLLVNDAYFVAVFEYYKYFILLLHIGC